MTSLGSILMYFEAIKRLQLFILSLDDTKPLIATPIFGSWDFDRKITKSSTCAIMASKGSIPMFFEVENWMQLVILDLNNYKPILATPIFGCGIF